MKEELQVFRKYDKTARQLVVWEEDAWGRRGREWTITDIPTWDFEEKPQEEQSYTEQKRVKERNITLGNFINDITEDFYNIRDTWAKRRVWTYDQVERFEEWLEHTRWSHP